MTEHGLYERDDLAKAAEQALRDLVDGFRAGATDLGSLLLVSGAAGLGKTSLLAQLRKAVAEYGSACTVLYARCGERAQDTPFHMVRQLLQPVMARIDQEHRIGFFDDTVYAIAGPALGRMAPVPGLQSDPQGVRDALDWLTTRIAVGRGPVVMIIDDLHWADPESLAWLASFATRIPGVPMLAAASFRPDEMPVEGQPLLEEASLGPRGQLLRLRVLTVAAVDALIRDEFGPDADNLFCHECWSITDGVPYDLVALVGKLKDRQLQAVDENIGLLRELVAAEKEPAIARRLSQLGTTTHRFAYAAAILDTEIDPDAAARVAAIPPTAARVAIEQLHEERILREVRDPITGRTTLEFVHPTIATAVYRSMKLGAMRTAMHGAAVDEVINAGRGMAAASRHLLEIHPDDNPEVVEQLREAAAEHVAMGAPAAARRCLERALDEPPLDEDRADVHYELGLSTTLTDPKVTIHHLRTALDAPAPGLSPERRETAVLRLGQALAHTNRMEEAAETTAEELLRTAPGLSRTRLEAAYFMWRIFLREVPDGRAESHRLTELSEDQDGCDSGARAVRVLCAFDLTLRGEGAVQALALAEHAFDKGVLAPDLGWTNTVWGFEIPVLLGLTYIYHDRLDRASELFNQAADEFEVVGWTGGHLAFANFMRGLVLFRWGRLEEAETFLKATLRKSDRLGRGTPLQWDIVGVLCDTLMARGKTGEAVALAAEYAFRPPFPPVMVLPDAPTLHGRLLLAQGRRLEAEQQLVRAGDQLDGRGWLNPVWAPWLCALAEAVVDEDPDRARMLAAEALRRAEKVATNSAVGSALRVCAAVADPADTVELLRQAVVRLGQSPAAYEFALALVDLGSALRRDGRAREAADALEQGVQLAAQCGADGLVVRARSELLANGATPHRLHAIAVRVLNEEERAVAELAAVGGSNQQIAEQLGIPESVAAQRLAAAYRKVGTGPEGLAAALGLEE